MRPASGPWMAALIAAAAAGSRWAVGSSSNSTGASRRNARASASAAAGRPKAGRLLVKRGAEAVREARR